MNDLSRHAERMAIRDMTSMDASRVLEIYQQGIDTGHATFQAAAPTWEAWDSSHLRSCRLVATYDGGIVGWAAVSPVSAGAGVDAEAARATTEARWDDASSTREAADWTTHPGTRFGNA